MIDYFRFQSHKKVSSKLLEYIYNYFTGKEDNYYSSTSLSDLQQFLIQDNVVKLNGQKDSIEFYIGPYKFLMEPVFSLSNNNVRILTYEQITQKYRLAPSLNPKIEVIKPATIIFQNGIWQIVDIGVQNIHSMLNTYSIKIINYIEEIEKS